MFTHLGVCTDNCIACSLGFLLLSHGLKEIQPETFAACRQPWIIDRELLAPYMHYLIFGKPTKLLKCHVVTIQLIHLVGWVITYLYFGIHTQLVCHAPIKKIKANVQLQFETGHSCRFLYLYNYS